MADNIDISMIEADDTENNKHSTDDDDNTVKSSGSSDKIDKGMMEYLIKWRVPEDDRVPDHNSAKDKICEVLSMLLECNSFKLIFIDSRGEEFVELNEIQKTTIKIHKSNNKANKKNNFIAVTRFRSDHRWSDIKAKSNLRSMLTGNKIYAGIHLFNAKEWDIISIGCILHHHVSHCPVTWVKEKIISLMKEQDNQLPFILQTSSVRTDDKTVATKAFDFTCQRKDAKKWREILTTGEFRKETNRFFLPYEYKRTKQEAFKKMLRGQNRMLAETYVIKVQGIKKDKKDIIAKHMRKEFNNHYLDMVPTKNNASSGEWRILVKEDMFYAMDSHLRLVWEELTVECDASNLSEENAFPPPEITSNPGVREDDRQESSYGSILTTGTGLWSVEDKNLEEYDNADDKLFEQNQDQRASYQTYRDATVTKTKQTWAAKVSTGITNNKQQDKPEESAAYKADGENEVVKQMKEMMAIMTTQNEELQKLRREAEQQREQDRQQMENLSTQLNALQRDLEHAKIQRHDVEEQLAQSRHQCTVYQQHTLELEMQLEQQNQPMERSEKASTPSEHQTHKKRNTQGTPDHRKMKPANLLTTFNTDDMEVEPTKEDKALNSNNQGAPGHKGGKE